jgi:hypothetical protein
MVVKIPASFKELRFLQLLTLFTIFFLIISPILSGPDDGYFFHRLPAHLKAAGQGEELRGLLLNYHWLKAKLAATEVNLEDLDRTWR